MIRFLRKLIFEDFWLKLFSLALAVLIWLTVTFVSQRGVGTEEHIFTGLPVTVLAAAEDVHNFKVNPGQVEVTVQGSPRTVQDLQSSDIRAIVDLTGVGAARELRKRVEVCVPPGVTFMHVRPEQVQIVFPPER